MEDRPLDDNWLLLSAIDANVWIEEIAVNFDGIAETDLVRRL